MKFKKISNHWCYEVGYDELEFLISIISKYCDGLKYKIENGHFTTIQYFNALKIEHRRVYYYLCKLVDVAEHYEADYDG